ncbi:MAG TPA: hypothetical protein VHK28_07870 [Candidatus Limnocylindria bacterium]|nr:hypothetical protein [Candidatus Limnocylindria bacterium]
MRASVPRWLPWALIGLTLAAAVPAMVLLYINEGSAELMEQVVYAGIFIGYGLVGALVATRRPENAIGWVLLGVSVLTGWGFFGEQYGRYGMITDPGSLPAPELVGWLGIWLWFPGIGLLLFGLLLFPNGSVPSPRWRPVAWLTAFAVVSISAVFAFTPSSAEDVLPNPFAVLPAGSVEVVEAVFGVTLLLAGLLCLGAPILRFRRAAGVERQQLKWFLYGGALLVVAFVLEPLAAAVPALRPAADLAFPLALAAMPVAIALAILRYGLYEVDRIISRTIGYALVSATLLAVYAGGALVLSQLTVPFTGDQTVAVAASTLAVVALFRPARRRIQAAVDRRFYRSRYDAQRTLDEFMGSARGEVDVDRLSAQLRSAATSTIHPAAVSVWLRDRV